MFLSDSIHLVIRFKIKFRLVLFIFSFTSLNFNKLLSLIHNLVKLSRKNKSISKKQATWIKKSGYIVCSCVSPRFFK